MDIPANEEQQNDPAGEIGIGFSRVFSCPQLYHPCLQRISFLYAPGVVPVTFLNIRMQLCAFV